jgi:LmbE family N-acetylglucosaminyl deacetylase
MNILAIGSHPDDIELGCGGTLLKAVENGHNLFLFTLTNGAASGNPIERTVEMLQSARMLKAKSLWIDSFQDGRLINGFQLISHLEYVINECDPDIVFTHLLSDYHHDHRAVAISTLEAGRNCHNIMSYEVPYSRKFDPQAYFDVSDVIDKKVRLIEIFASQRGKPLTRRNSVKALAQFRAIQDREEARYVEGFEVMRLHIGNSFNLIKPFRAGVRKVVIETIKSPMNGMIKFQPKDGTFEIGPRIGSSDGLRMEGNNGSKNEMTRRLKQILESVASAAAEREIDDLQSNQAISRKVSRFSQQV